MSASLVGSEMCIRDRPSKPTPSWRPPPGAPRSSRLPRAQQPSHRPWRGAVSYTHLTLPTICSV
eukprot:1796545-Alexandrium_andersonii.AAC.1